MKRPTLLRRLCRFLTRCPYADPQCSRKARCERCRRDRWEGAQW